MFLTLDFRLGKTLGIDYPATGHCKYFLCSYGVKGFDLKILQSVYLINHILFFCGVFLSPIDQHTLFIGRAKADH